MKSWIVVMLCVLLNLRTAFAVPQVIDQVAANVNNGVVLQSDVNNMVRQIKVQAQQARQQLPSDTILYNQVLERLIMDTIILQMGERAGLRISEAELDQSIAHIAQQNGISLEQLRSRLRSQGVDFNTYRAQIRKEMIISEVRNNEVRRRITILPQEVDALAAQLAEQHAVGTELNLSHILLGLPPNATDEQNSARAGQAEYLVNQLKKGANFSKSAITYSTDGTALRGGVMGWSKIEEIPQLFVGELSTAKQGDIVGPIRSEAGWHIFKVNALRNEHQPLKVTEFHARHILLKTSPILSNEQAIQQLKQIAAEIKAQKITFAEAAKRYSEDPANANQGGDLGWNVAEAFDPAFGDVLRQLTVGSMSAPVRTTFGWHLIELIATREVDKTETALKDRAWRMLFNRKFAENAQAWAQEQRASAWVKIAHKNG